MQVIGGNQVSVELAALGGYYFLTGGQAPVINATTGTPFSTILLRCSHGKLHNE